MTILNTKPCSYCDFSDNCLNHCAVLISECLSVKYCESLSKVFKRMFEKYFAVILDT
ncbi:IS4/Tn5 family transposase DNA-binding protein [Nostoc sp.]|uniref:IS4/Tn5 family transposase DNA-binding protein n=1 Tax=Nostoc sp. TaxID=1180 RepID=UPI003FA5EDC7